MHIEPFDELARALANGVTRRQLLKGLAVGAGAHLLAAAGLGATVTRPTPLYAAGENSAYAPIIITAGGRQVGTVDICPVASTCAKKVYCSEDNGCRCIQSAEGDIRCGQTPSCDAQTCTTSADCANLGDGYFCDSPDSGCCAAGVQLCLAPCWAPMTCPEERICDATCCPEGTVCSGGACMDPITGTWTGTVTYAGQSIGVRFILARDNTALSGRMLMQDPVTGEYLESGAISGSHHNFFSVWETEAGSYVDGSFDGASFSGLFSFPARHDEEGFDAQIALQRTGN
jgi:hypothetical protein